jgi:hypothetical protein
MKRCDKSNLSAAVNHARPYRSRTTMAVYAAWCSLPRATAWKPYVPQLTLLLQAGWARFVVHRARHAGLERCG